MKPGHGKHKGTAFERKVCQQLGAWLTHGSNPDCLWRSAMSGGRATVRAAKGKTGLESVAGDICAVHEDGAAFVTEFFIECKSYSLLDYLPLVTRNEGRLVKFWQTAQEQAATHGKIPLLIFKQNLFPVQIGISPKHTWWSPRILQASAFFPSIDLAVFSFEDFLARVPSDDWSPPIRRRALK